MGAPGTSSGPPDDAAGAPADSPADDPAAILAGPDDVLAGRAAAAAAATDLPVPAGLRDDRPGDGRDLRSRASDVEEAGSAAAEVEAALAVPPDPASAAFFDVDNTIMQGASIFHLARGLYRRNFFTIRDILGFAWHQAQFILVGENMEHVEEIQEKALSFVAGHSVAELRAVGEEVFDELMADKIWPGTHALARMHVDAGQRVWLVTATPVEVADVIAGRLGLTGALGTVAEHVDGVYTGRLVGKPMHGAAKAEAVKALAETEGLDLDRCSAYSDSSNDIPLLSLVGNPCAINPDATLRAHARAEGWRVRDYRTGRKAVRASLPVAMVAGAVAGAAAGAMAFRRRR
jgi:HAD superfamily hydrolase (TIGR01490 family)